MYIGRRPKKDQMDYPSVNPVIDLVKQGGNIGYRPDGFSRTEMPSKNFANLSPYSTTTPMTRGTPLVLPGKARKLSASAVQMEQEMFNRLSGGGSGNGGESSRASQMQAQQAQQEGKIAQVGAATLDQNLINRFATDREFRMRVAGNPSMQQQFRDAFMRQSANAPNAASSLIQQMNLADQGKPTTGVDFSAGKSRIPRFNRPNVEQHTAPGHPSRDVAARTQFDLSTQEGANAFYRHYGAIKSTKPGNIVNASHPQAGNPFDGFTTPTDSGGRTSSATGMSGNAKAGGGNLGKFSLPQNSGLFANPMSTPRIASGNRVQSQTNSGATQAQSQSQSQLQSHQNTVQTGSSENFLDLSDPVLAQNLQAIEYLNSREEERAAKRRKEDRQTAAWAFLAQQLARMFEPVPVDVYATAKLSSQWR